MSPTAEDLLEEVTEVIRDAPPTHYSFKVESFSLLSTNSVQKYESCDFQVGNYKWKLILHPNGNSTRDVNDHISMYLAIADTSCLPSGWEVNVIYKFFVFDQIRDKYLTLADAGGQVRRFHGIRTKLGFSKLISLATFTDPSNGYLVDDTCEFGVEVFVVAKTGGSECLTMLSTTYSYEHSWKIEKFSSPQLKNEAIYSDVFTSGNHKWKIRLDPMGYGDGLNTSLSLFLYLADLVPLSGAQIYAKFKFRLRNQAQGNHIEETEHHWFKNTTTGYGHPKFISLQEFKDPIKGFLVNDTCIVEAEVTVLGSRKST